VPLQQPDRAGLVQGVQTVPRIYALPGSPEPVKAGCGSLLGFESPGARRPFPYSGKSPRRNDAWSPIWRIACQGVGVFGHVWLVGVVMLWLRLAGRSGRSRVRDGGHAHIRGLATPGLLFVARPLSKVERGDRVGGGCSGD
jgi:hypothetical protein